MSRSKQLHPTRCEGWRSRQVYLHVHTIWRFITLLILINLFIYHVQVEIVWPHWLLRLVDQ